MSRASGKNTGPIKRRAGLAPDIASIPRAFGYTVSSLRDRGCRIASWPGLYFRFLSSACAISRWCFNAGSVLPAQSFSLGSSPDAVSLLERYANGAEYDSMQVSAHKDAVSLFERYANGGEDPKLKDWAGKTLPALKHHLEMAQALDKNRK